ncbi:unnamed protein product [Ilex paraguariensis]|uniref:Squalene synthase n=1 Tax=Ilex paraguariensis TaxID=185542 RepID=A0ABC8RAS7_9AQUA
MDQFHDVSTAFLELGSSYQEAIEDITMRMGAGMAKFICKEVETIDDYDEYCHYVAGLVGLGLSKLFHASGSEDLLSDSLSNSMGLFLQKTNIIRDYLEDINEIPKSRMFWPRQIWSKYVNKLEELKYEENSVKAVQCLNDMVTNALFHVEDCLTYMSSLRDPAIFRFCAIPQAVQCLLSSGARFERYKLRLRFRKERFDSDPLPEGIASLTACSYSHRYARKQELSFSHALYLKPDKDRMFHLPYRFHCP